MSSPPNVPCPNHPQASTRERRVFAICLILGGLLGLAGCHQAGADYSRVELLKVSGRVSLDGQPLSAAVVTFESPDGQFSFGLTDAQGYYSLQLDSDRAGVTPGPKVVRISTARQIVGLNASEGGEGTEAGREAGIVAATPPERLPARYHQASELKADVTSAKTTFDFELASR